MERTWMSFFLIARIIIFSSPFAAQAWTPSVCGQFEDPSRNFLCHCLEEARGLKVDNALQAKRASAEQVILSSCLGCHATQGSVFSSAAEKRGKFRPFILTGPFFLNARLDETYLLASQAIIPGDPDNSSFFESIEEGRMPHRSMRHQHGSRLPAEKIEIVRNWILAMKPLPKGCFQGQGKFGVNSSSTNLKVSTLKGQK